MKEKKKYYGHIGGWGGNSVEVPKWVSYWQRGSAIALPFIIFGGLCYILLSSKPESDNNSLQQKTEYQIEFDNDMKSKEESIKSIRLKTDSLRNLSQNKLEKL